MKIYAELESGRQQFGGVKPSGWVEVTSERPSPDYVASDSGEWVLKDNSKTNEEVEALRSTAYADPLTGSDRLLNDYQASIALGSDDAEDKKEAWLARREEIKSKYPFNS